jgi:hypothetical protein
MEIDETLQDLAEYAHENYCAGGHWIFECYEAPEYQAVLDACSGDLDKAKAALKARWEFKNELSTECGDF